MSILVTSYIVISSQIMSSLEVLHGIMYCTLQTSTLHITIKISAPTFTFYFVKICYLYGHFGIKIQNKNFSFLGKLYHHVELLSMIILTSQSRKLVVRALK